MQRALVGIGIAVILLVSGCSAQSGTKPAATEHTETYDQALEWGECDPLDDEDVDEAFTDAGFEESDRECAEITVPQDWNEPDSGKTITVALERIRSTGDSKGSIVFNPGGPGEPGTTMPVGMAINERAQELIQNYDLVGFDPRGIGKSTPLDCDDIIEENEDQAAIFILAECINANDIAHFMGTSSVARDVDVIRHLLGDDKLNYVGYSYGTVLGATYAELFPDTVGHMLLDSALDAQWSGLPATVAQQQAMSSAVIRYANACDTAELKTQVEAEGVDEITCPFTSKRTLRQYLTRLDKKPAVATDGTKIDAEAALGFILAELYAGTEERTGVYVLLSELVAGNQEVIDLVASAEDADIDAAGLIVRCHSFHTDMDIAGYRKQLADKPAPLPWLENDDGEPGPDLSCFALKEVGTDVMETFTAKGSAPILVLGITGDHATPYKYGKSLADGLDNGHFVTLEGEGHGASYEESSCIDKIVNAYFLKDELPEEGMRCQPDQ